MTENQRVIAGRYEVGNLIGRGGMADVYEGVDTRLGRTVAIKLLKSDLANDPSFEARFRQEAQDPLGLSWASYLRDPRSVDPSALQFNTRKSIDQQQLGWSGTASGSGLARTSRFFGLIRRLSSSSR